MPIIWAGIEGLATLVGLSVGIKSLTSSQQTAEASQTTANNTTLLKYAAYTVAAWYVAKKAGLLK